MLYPFSVAEVNSEECIDRIQFQSLGTLTAFFLSVNAKVRTIKFAISNENIDCIKELVQTGTGFEEDAFRWPFGNAIITGNSREDFYMEFQNVYDGRNKNIHHGDKDNIICYSSLHNVRTYDKDE